MSEFNFPTHENFLSPLENLVHVLSSFSPSYTLQVLGLVTVGFVEGDGELRARHSAVLGYLDIFGDTAAKVAVVYIHWPPFR